MLNASVLELCSTSLQSLFPHVLSQHTWRAVPSSITDVSLGPSANYKKYVLQVFVYCCVLVNSGDVI